MSKDLIAAEVAIDCTASAISTTVPVKTENTVSTITSEKVRAVLNVGEEVKNYKVMCELLGEKVKTGNAKRAQTNEWLRFFDYENVGQRFVVREIYDTPLLKSVRKGDTYMSKIETILTSVLSQCSGYSCRFTKQQLFKKLYMVNENYGSWKYTSGSPFKYEIIEQKSTIPVDKLYVLNAWEADLFYDVAAPFLSSTLKRALDNLERRGVIKYSIHSVAVTHTICNDVLVAQRRIATPCEEKGISDIQKMVVQEMGFPNTSDIYFTRKVRPYFKKVNKALKEQYNWDYTYKEYEITCNETYIQHQLPEIQENLENLVEIAGVPLNKAIAEGINKAILANRQRTGKKKYIEMENGDRISFSKGPNPMFDAERTQVYARQKLLTELMIRVAPESYCETYKTTVCLDTTNSIEIE